MLLINMCGLTNKWIFSITTTGETLWKLHIRHSCWFLINAKSYDKTLKKVTFSQKYVKHFIGSPWNYITNFITKNFLIKTVLSRLVSILLLLSLDIYHDVTKIDMTREKGMTSERTLAYSAINNNKKPRSRTRIERG